MTKLNYTFTKLELHLYPEGSYYVNDEGRHEQPFTKIIVYIDTDTERHKMPLSELVGCWLELHNQ